MLAAGLALLLAAQESAAHWPLDGDFGKDGKGLGRATFIDSPVGDSGRMLVLNGVDAGASLGGTPGGTGDFTVSVWIFPLEMRAAGIASRGWSLDLLAEGAFRFNTLQSPARSVFAGQWYHVVVVVPPGGKGATLYVNAEAAATGDVRVEEAAGPLLLGRREGEAKPFCGFLDDLRIWTRPLSLPNVQGVLGNGLPWLGRRPYSAEPFDSKFLLHGCDAVVFTGGENAYSAQLEPFLEARLLLDDPDRPIFCRSFAWEGDTVYEQWRILNFGPWERQFERVGASLIFCQFGQMEALQGREAIPAFVEAYGRLLDEFSRRTKRIVLLSPLAFQKTKPPLPDLTARNEEVRAYAEAVRDLAGKRKCLYVDLFGPTSKGIEGLTRDGVHLTSEGHATVARLTAQALGLKEPKAVSPNLMTLLRQKNAIWIDYWRPTNWAFLNGDRMEQPSSRDHTDRRVRWFPVEVQKAQALLRDKELAIWNLNRETPK